jgi:hypothetical protein
MVGATVREWRVILDSWGKINTPFVWTIHQRESIVYMIGLFM